MSDLERLPLVHRNQEFVPDVPWHLLRPTTQQILREWGCLLRDLAARKVAPTTERQRIFLDQIARGEQQISCGETVSEPDLCASAKAWLDLVHTRTQFQKQRARKLKEWEQQERERQEREQQEREQQERERQERERRWLRTSKDTEATYQRLLAQEREDRDSFR
jgi:hypothetical protein